MENSSEIQVIVDQPQQESEAPAKDAVTKLDRLLYLLGKVTRPSTAKTPEEGGTRIERPLHTRRIRAELLRDVHAIPEDKIAERQKTLGEAREWDRLNQEFLNQGSVTVSLPGLGEQEARYNVLTPRAETQTDAEEQPPIVIIPGISNDLDCVSTMAESLAYGGRRVICVGYPESFMGRVTDAFATEVEQRKNLELHTQFFQSAIQELTQQYPNIELWGLSTGGPIAAEILSNPQMQEKVANAVFISPAGCVEQSQTSMGVGVAREATGLLKRFGSLMPKFVMTTGRKEGEDEAMVNLRKRVSGSLMEAITNRSSAWDTMQVQEGGKIVIVWGGKDHITKGYKAINSLGHYAQVSAALLPDENHTSSFNSPDVLNKVEELQAS